MRNFVFVTVSLFCTGTVFSQVHTTTARQQGVAIEQKNVQPYVVADSTVKMDSGRFAKPVVTPKVDSGATQEETKPKVNSAARKPDDGDTY